MYLQQIRNATIFYIMAEKILIDPVLAPKGSWPPFPNSIRQAQNNPLVKLPVPVDELLKAGTNRMLNSELLIMGKEDVYELWKVAPNATLIASHMEAVNHWTLSRRELAVFSRLWEKVSNGRKTACSWHAIQQLLYIKQGWEAWFICN